MCRGFLRCASLVVCVCFILSTLFLNTLQVEAVSNSFTFSTRFYPNAISNHVWGSISGGGGYINNGSGSITSNSGSTHTTTHDSYSYHVSIPFLFRCNWSDIGGDSSFNKNLDKYFTLWFNSISISNTSGTVQNKKVYLDIDNYIVWDGTYSRHFYLFGGSVRGLGNDVAIPFRLEYDVSFEQQDNIGVSDDPIDYFDSNMTVAINIGGRTSSDAEIASQQTQVKEANSEQIAESEKAIEESVTSDTGGGILATIKNFFGSFFQNVFDTLVSVFVPEDGFFSDWFNRLNTLLSEKLGMLYAPFDLLITTLNAIMNADSTDTGIPFPGIQWEDTYLVEPFTFYFSSLGDTFTDLQGYVYFATDTVLLFAFLYLLQNKIRLILEGHESG